MKKTRRKGSLGLLLVSLLLSLDASALTIEGFRAICAANDVTCEQIPVLQAYVGGALDMIATLDERTEYLGTVYCRTPKQLFDVPAIIRHVETAAAPDSDVNAMTLVVDYLVRNGGCQQRR
ncbi:MAG: hypothetical protein AAGG11_09540 [Pseudomonadota bacterium]